MPWTKKKDKWNYSSGDLEGYIVLVKYKSGKQEYQGMVWNNKTKKIAPHVRADTLAACKAGVQKQGRSLKERR